MRIVLVWCLCAPRVAQLLSSTLSEKRVSNARASGSGCGFKFGDWATNPKLVSAFPEEVPTSPKTLGGVLGVGALSRFPPPFFLGGLFLFCPLFGSGCYSDSPLSKLSRKLGEGRVGLFTVKKIAHLRSTYLTPPIHVFALACQRIRLVGA